MLISKELWELFVCQVQATLCKAVLYPQCSYGTCLPLLYATCVPLTANHGGRGASSRTFQLVGANPDRPIAGREKWVSRRRAGASASIKVTPAGTSRGVLHVQRCL
jgi:hypothetical protein